MTHHAPVCSAPPIPQGSPWIDFQSHDDDRGGLVVAEGATLPFKVERVYWLHNLSGQPRGGHAHRRLWQVIVPLSGALTVRVTSAHGSRSHRLDTPKRGLLIGPMTWRVLGAIKPGTACLVLASAVYDEADYIRDPNTFRRALLASVPRPATSIADIAYVA